MKKEIRVPYDKLKDPQTITKVNQRIFEEMGFHLKRHETDIEDDHDRQERIYAIQTERKYFYSK